MTKDAIIKLQGRIRKVFLDHKVQSHYGICLLHDHFEIAKSRRLVEHGLVSLPRDLGDEDKNTPLPTIINTGSPPSLVSPAISTLSPLPQIIIHPRV
jgi:hypothetical protein